MNRANFGQVLKSLREDKLDYITGSTWSQEKLADASDLSKDIISNVERGKKSHLDRDTLVSRGGWNKIATANLYQFCYTSLRHRFTSRFSQLLQHLKSLPDFPNHGCMLERVKEIILVKHA